MSVWQLMQKLPNKWITYLFACDCIEHVLSLYVRSFPNEDHLYKIYPIIQTVRQFIIEKRKITETDDIFWRTMDMLKKMLHEAVMTKTEPQKSIKMILASIANAIMYVICGKAESAVRKCRIAIFWLGCARGDEDPRVAMKTEEEWQIKRLKVYLEGTKLH